MSRHQIARRNTFVRGESFIYGITYSEIPARPHGEEYVKAKDTQGRSLPYFGYYYRILRAQGADAPGGAYDYVVRSKMIGGFALVAYPANWGNSGVMTFSVNHDGIV
jgi:DUF2950 family protein